MNEKLPKTIKHYLVNGGFWNGKVNKNMTFVHKDIIDLTCCNLTVFIVYVPVLSLCLI